MTVSLRIGRECAANSGKSFPGHRARTLARIALWTPLLAFGTRSQAQPSCPDGPPPIVFVLEVTAWGVPDPVEIIGYPGVSGSIQYGGGTLQYQFGDGSASLQAEASYNLVNGREYHIHIAGRLETWALSGHWERVEEEYRLTSEASANWVSDDAPSPPCPSVFWASGGRWQGGFAEVEVDRNNRTDRETRTESWTDNIVGPGIFERYRGFLGHSYRRVEDGAFGAYQRGASAAVGANCGSTDCCNYLRSGNSHARSDMYLSLRLITCNASVHGLPELRQGDYPVPFAACVVDPFVRCLPDYGCYTPKPGDPTPEELIDAIEQYYLLQHRGCDVVVMAAAFQALGAGATVTPQWLDAFLCSDDLYSRVTAFTGRRWNKERTYWVPMFDGANVSDERWVQLSRLHPAELPPIYIRRPCSGRSISETINAALRSGEVPIVRTGGGEHWVLVREARCTSTTSAGCTDDHQEYYVIDPARRNVNEGLNGWKCLESLAGITDVKVVGKVSNFVEPVWLGLEESGAARVSLIAGSDVKVQFDSRTGLTSQSLFDATHEIVVPLIDPYEFPADGDLVDPDSRSSVAHVEQLPPGTYTVQVTALLDGLCGYGATWTSETGEILHRNEIVQLTAGQSESFDITVGYCPPGSDCARCFALDVNKDGFVTGDDFDFFVTEFIAGNASADFNADGFVTGDDFDAFVVAFVSGY